MRAGILLRLAQELDDVGDYDLADEVDRGQPWGNDPVDWVGRRYLSGMTLMEIASLLGYNNHARPQQLLDRFWARNPRLEELHRRGQRRNVSWDLISEVGEGAESGLTYGEIAEILGLHLDAARTYHVLYCERFPDRCRVAPSVPNRQMKRSQEENIALSEEAGRLRMEGMTNQEVAERMNLTEGIVQYLFQKVFLPRHPEIERRTSRDKNEMRNLTKAIAEDYISGLPVENIATKHDIRALDIWSLAMTHLSSEELAEMLRTKRRDTPRMMEDCHVAKRMRLAGTPIETISDVLGRNDQYVRKLLKIAVALDPTIAPEITKLAIDERRRKRRTP